VARVAPAVQGAEGVVAAVAEQAQPLGELAHTAAEKVRDLATGLAVGDPEHGGEALEDTLVVGLVAAALEFLALLQVEGNWLHRSRAWAGLGPFGGGGCCSVPEGIVD
jgi:hypothetical protein